MRLTPESLGEMQAALTAAGVDGWLLYDFRGLNPIAGEFLGIEGFISRRVFAFIPATGTPVALTHAIEQGVWHRWPAAWSKEVYSSWKSLEGWLSRTVNGKRVAMEYSAGDAVPYLDRIPAGVVEMVRNAGAEVVTSGGLVSRFYATWGDDHIASHERPAETIATIARDAFRLIGERTRGGRPIAEHEVMQWIRDRFAAAGLSTDHGPNVSASENAANPHYEPSADTPRVIREGDVVLIDLWAKEEGGVYADQTWMASVGAPSDESLEIWNAVRDARDAAIELVTTQIAAGVPIRGADVDDAARAVIEARGFGQYFTHRTGHSIDSRDLHGSGPHLDNLETRDDRELIRGVGFSIEPGIYVPGKVGMRSEVNVYVRDDKAVVTPRVYQRELIVV